MARGGFLTLVLQLSGLGSDELGGGYTRHRSAFDVGGWSALNEEVRATIYHVLRHLI